MSDVVTEEAARRFVAAVPGTGYVDIADAAHMVAGDKNDVFGRPCSTSSPNSTDQRR